MEGRAVEMLLYSNHNIHGLLQTEEYARALLRTWRPAYSPDQLERMLAGRMARKPSSIARPHRSSALSRKR